MAPSADKNLVERVFREANGPAVATLTRVFGDITLAEDAVQDAFAVALQRWVDDGVPPNPAGWIVTTARNRAIDKLRRDTRGRALHSQLGVLTPDSVDPAEITEDEAVVEDDQLRLIFTCCHPSIRVEDRIALTLRLLGGLSVEEVARSFLVGEPAMAKRLVRAKRKISDARIPYRVPGPEELPERLHSVLTVIYLIYTIGVDDPARSPLRADAIRLGRALMGLMADEPEVMGLVALLLLSEARASARYADGELVLLRHQDRSLWDRSLIEEGHALVRTCIRRNLPGPFQVQAAIQAVHCAAPSFEHTDWAQVVTLYDQLVTLLPTPVVQMNRAIAVGEHLGPEEGLAALDGLTGALDGNHSFHASRATMLSRLGRREEALVAFERAYALAQTETSRTSISTELESLR